MTNTTETRSPKLSPPSDRDLEIFRHAQIHHRTHCAIALDFDVTRRRVGQIVQEVHRWLATHGTTDPEINTDAQRQRQARGLERMRLQDIVQRAVHALNNAPLTLTTSAHVESKLQTKYVREQPPVDHRILKTYLQAVLALGKLEERKPLPAPQPAYEPWNDPKIQSFLTDWAENNDIEWETPEEYQDFVKQLTQTIQNSLTESSQGSPPTPSGTEAQDGPDSDSSNPQSEIHNPQLPQGSPPTPSGTEAPDGAPSFNPEPQATELDAEPQATASDGTYDSATHPNLQFAIRNLQLPSTPHLLPSASPASLPEEPPVPIPPASTSDATNDSSTTSNTPPGANSSASQPIPPPENLEKGSATVAPHASNLSHPSNFSHTLASLPTPIP